MNIYLEGERGEERKGEREGEVERVGRQRNRGREGEGE